MGCQVQALRAIEPRLGLEKLYVIGTNCADNGPRDQAPDGDPIPLNVVHECGQKRYKLKRIKRMGPVWVRFYEYYLQIYL